MTRIVYDCEIIRCIPSKGVEINGIFETKEAYYNRFGDGFEYCGGWRDFENMGISIIGACDIDTGDLYTFVNPLINGYDDTPTINEFENFVTVETEVWGFNSLNFDDALCAANLIQVDTDHDLLQLVRLAAYGSTDWQDQPPGYSYSLDALARANGFKKSGSGELAPKLWQQGKYQEVIDYCLNDCKITRELILLYEAGKLIDPNTGQVLGKGY